MDRRSYRTRFDTTSRLMEKLTSALHGNGDSLVPILQLYWCSVEVFVFELSQKADLSQTARKGFERTWRSMCRFAFVSCVRN